jgi:rubrerythrin
MKVVVRIKYLSAFVLLAAAASVSATVPTPNKTLKNLQAAYDGESNAHAKYLEFAKQADREGYGKAASLFRAAAAAEQIHGACEAAVIKRMAATPQAELKLPPIKSTKQNLEESANKGEAYERDTMYPRFIRQADKDANKAAARCFAYASSAEAEHFKLFTAAANDLDKMKGRPAIYYVCSEDGYTMAKLNAGKCPGGEYQEVR